MLWAMSRWKPDAVTRLEAAAMELYLERGYEQTTVAEIARNADLTERTFFRHFADKREVLFKGSEWFQELFVEAIAAAPASATPREAVQAGLDAAGRTFHGRRERSRRRHAIIGSHPELQERELIKMASLATAMAAALRERGAADLTASVTAETAVAVFRVGYERWVTSDDDRELATHLADAVAELRVATGG